MVLLAIVITVLTALSFATAGRGGRCTPSAAILRRRGLEVWAPVGWSCWRISSPGSSQELQECCTRPRLCTVNPASAGAAFELQVIAATVIGGTSVLGGRGGIGGTLLGALFLGTTANALAVTGVSGFWQRAIEGLIILIAVALDSKLRRVRLGGGEVKHA